MDKVRLGQTAKITSDALIGELRGTVEHIGLQVQRQNIVNTDPSANIDSRIVEVKVRLVDTLRSEDTEILRTKQL